MLSHGAIRSCVFVSRSELGLTDAQDMAIRDSSKITFGDADRTLITATRLFNIVGHTENLKQIMDICPLMLVDLES